jgi:hypothetical protein
MTQLVGESLQVLDEIDKIIFEIQNKLAPIEVGPIKEDTRSTGPIGIVDRTAQVHSRLLYFKNNLLTILSHL